MSVPENTVQAAQRVILAALVGQDPSASGIAIALESACLLQSPETAVEQRRMRLAWRSARERAQAYGEGILRHVADRDSWMGWAKAAEAEVARLRAERHSTNETLNDAAEALRVQRDRIAELEAERRKYVGVEPTVAEEMTYMNRCLNAVYAVCDAAEKQATRWEQPLPVPEWVALVRNAADGLTLADPALPPAAPARQVEDPHDSPLHHDYALGHDLPAPTTLPETLR